MQNTQTCPVCGKEQIPMDRQQCPQCNSDLTCFQVLDTLMEQREQVERGAVEREPLERGSVEHVPLERGSVEREPMERGVAEREPMEWESVRAERSRIVWLPATILLVFLIGGLGWVFYQNLLIIQTVKDNHKSLEYVDRSVQDLVRKVELGKAEVEPEKERQRERPPVNISRGVPSKGLERMSDNAKIQEEVPCPGEAKVNTPADEKAAIFPTKGRMAVKPSVEGKAVKPSAKVKGHAAEPKCARFFWYETTDKDTLWGIAERFYQSGRYYPVLLIMNPQISIYEIKAGQRFKILENQKDVITAFNRSIEREGLCVYIWYQVQEDDTLKTLSRKFYKTDDQYSIINQINPSLHLEPGQRIRVLLPDLP